MSLPSYVKRRNESYQKWAARQRFVDLRKSVSVDEMTDGDMADVADAVDNRTGGNSDPMAHVNALASLICEAQPNVDRASALRFLLNTSHGAALIARTKRKEQNVAYGSEEWAIIAKNAPLNFVNAIEEGHKTAGDPFLTNAVAKAAHPDLSEARAFAKFVDERPITQKFAFRSVDPYSYMQSEPLRKAAPQATLKPEFVGADEATRSANGTDDAAYEQLMALVAELRRSNPELSDAQAFARVYTDPNNHALAEAERRANRPRGGEGYF